MVWPEQSERSGAAGRELSQMEDEQITRIKKERRLRREEEEEEDIRSGVSQIGPDDDSVWSRLRIECNKGLTTAG